MINNTTLVGRLTKNPETRYTGSGIGVTNFTLAVERNFTNAQGEKETDFINCVIWREAAENLSKLAVKGTLLGITGAIQTRNYENNEGQTVFITEVRADNFQLLEPKSVNEERRNKQPATQSKEQPKTQAKEGWAKKIEDDNPFESNDVVTDISDDDLPF